MAAEQRFEDLRVWQDARTLVREVYQMTNGRSFRRDFSLKDQITRAAISTMSNIAEGFERGTRKEFIQFLSIAKGSNAEVRSQFYVALDQGYLDQETFDQARNLVLALSRRLARFIDYLRTFRGDARRSGRKPSA